MHSKHLHVHGITRPPPCLTDEVVWIMIIFPKFILVSAVQRISFHNDNYSLLHFFEPHDDILYFHQHLCGPHIDNSQKQLPNANRLTRPLFPQILMDNRPHLGMKKKMTHGYNSLIFLLNPTDMKQNIYTKYLCSFQMHCSGVQWKQLRIRKNCEHCVTVQKLVALMASYCNDFLLRLLTLYNTEALLVLPDRSRTPGLPNRLH